MHVSVHVGVWVATQIKTCRVLTVLSSVRGGGAERERAPVREWGGGGVVVEKDTDPPPTPFREAVE